MAKRKSISLTTRFEVFKRDSFTCGYCGQKPPDVILEIDHILAVKNGGDNDFDNLITSCFDCNRGKSARSLDQIINGEKVDNILPLLKERELQYMEYRNFLLNIDNRLREEVDAINSVFQRYFPDREFTEKFKISVKRFIKELGLMEVVNSMEIAASKINKSGECLDYFCGICWNKIKKKNG